MVAVPADRPGHVQGNLREESQQGGNLVRNHFRRMIMPGIHQRYTFVHIHGGIGESKLSAAHGIGFHADAEHLAFHTGLDLFEIIGFPQDFINGFTIAHPRSDTVRRNILESVSGPDVHHTGLPQFLRQIGADPDTCFAVFNPELAGFLLRTGQGQRIAFGMGEEGGVKIAAQAAVPAELHPLFEMLRFQLVPVCPFSVLKNGIAGMQVHFRGSRNQG